MNEKVAWIHPGARRLAVLPDGSEVSHKEAKAKGFELQAWPKGQSCVPFGSGDQVSLPRGAVTSREEAEAYGFVVRSPQPASVAPPASSWRTAIFASPETRDRPSAVAELVTSQSPETMSVEQARAFLRGLPIEQEEKKVVTTENHDPRAARRAEIATSMRAFNRERGYSQPQSAATRSAPVASSIPPERLKRHAEIRLNALEVNKRAHTQEFKALKLAIDSHNATGVPIDRALSQLGIDPSTLIPSNR
jgi:hypothetical protein